MPLAGVGGGGGGGGGTQIILHALMIITSGVI